MPGRLVHNHGEESIRQGIETCVPSRGRRHRRALAEIDEAVARTAAEDAAATLNEAVKYLANEIAVAKEVIDNPDAHGNDERVIGRWES